VLPKKLYKDTYKKINIIKKSTILKFFLLKKRKLISNEVKNFSKLGKELYNYKKLKVITNKTNNTKYYINMSRLLNYYNTKKNQTIIFNCMYLNKHVSDHYSIDILMRNRNLITKNTSFLYKNLFTYTESE
jgi:flagellar biosynthesis regulator FlbT